MKKFLCLTVCLLGFLLINPVHPNNTDKQEKIRTTEVKIEKSNLYKSKNDTNAYPENTNEEMIENIQFKIREILLNAEMNELKTIEDKREWFVEYKRIINKYSKWFDPPETIYDVFTDDEINLICKTVETECYMADFISKCNVASVIFNRIEMEGYGDTITNIICCENQFVYGRDNITEDTILAVEYAFCIEDTTNGCVAFRSDVCPPSWYKWEYVFTDESGHHFYK